MIIYTGRKNILGDRFEVEENKLSPEHVLIEIPQRCKSGNLKSLIRYDTEFKKEIYVRDTHLETFGTCM